MGALLTCMPICLGLTVKLSHSTISVCQMSSKPLLGFAVSGCHIFPVDNLPDLLQIICLDIVVLQVVGVLPHVHPKQRHQTLCQWSSLVKCAQHTFVPESRLLLLTRNCSLTEPRCMHNMHMTNDKDIRHGERSAGVLCFVQLCVRTSFNENVKGQPV